MMTEKSKSRLGKIEEEHDRLRDTIASVRSALQAAGPPGSKPESPDWASTLADVLTSFHDQIFDHFRDEEQSGFLAEMERVFPHAKHRVDGLRREHDRILAEVRDVLAATIVYAAGRTPEHPALRRWTLSILDRITKHEHDEGELLQKLLYTDLGQAD
jgi:iron-sulfur cluster repair protein YtfE (RIC family)